MLTKLRLENFRNFTQADFELGKTTLVIGSNGAGKTNLLEAPEVLSRGRSFRASHETEFISWGQNLARVEGTLVEKGRPERKLALVFAENGKKAFFQGQPRPLAQVLGQLLTVAFAPEDLVQVAGHPQLRRRRLNLLLSQTDRHYFLRLLEYQKVLKARNRLLGLIAQGQAESEELASWDQQLIEVGSILIAQRREALEKLNRLLRMPYQVLGGGAPLKIRYFPSVAEEEFGAKLTDNFLSELEAKFTLFGPHRDDLGFFAGQKDLRVFGSRGEGRLSLVALTLAEVEYVRKEKGESPLLLLDDVFSELDERHRELLAKATLEGQAIISATEATGLEGLTKKAKVIALGSK